MLIINPVITESNAEICLDVNETTDIHIPLMEYIGNDQLNRFLPDHQISFSLRKKDLESPFSLGQLLYVTQDDIIVLCVGVGPSMSIEDAQELADTIIEGTREDEIYFSESVREIPGASEVLDAMMEKREIKSLSWSELRAVIKGLHLESSEKDKRKESLL